MKSKLMFAFKFLFLLVFVGISSISIAQSEIAVVKYSPENIFRSLPDSATLELNLQGKSLKIPLIHSITVASISQSSQVDKCHYEGYVDSYTESDVAISLCSPETAGGLIVLSGRVFIVMSACEPAVLCKSGVEYNFTVYGDVNALPQQPSIWSSQAFLHHRARRDVRPTASSPLPSEASTLKFANVNEETLYIRLLLASDSIQNDKNNLIPQQTERRALHIANVAALFMRPLNIVLYVLEHRILSHDDVDSYNTTMLLANTKKYRATKVDPVRDDVDILHLLTGSQIDPSTGENEDVDLLGQAYVSSVCTAYSVSFSVDVSNSIVQVGATMAHEIGHLLGLSHDKAGCTCAGTQQTSYRGTPKIVANATKCLMVAAKSVTGIQPLSWSNCSYKKIADTRRRLPPTCLRTKPKLAGEVFCGNGVVEPGEDCDCGSPTLVDLWSKVMDFDSHPTRPPCSLSCCDSARCRFSRPNVTCATGKCCNLDTCQLLPKHTECRGALSECDLPEYCSGQSEYCPHDLHKATGYSCTSGANSTEGTPGTPGLCFAGHCHSRPLQCRQLWGPTAKEAPASCYLGNRKGYENQNCGHEKLLFTEEGELIRGIKMNKCPTDEDTFCGTLQCQADNSTKKRHLLTGQTLSEDAYKCDWMVAAIEPDYGLVFNGTKCRPPGTAAGTDGICINNLCVSLNKTETVIAATLEAEGLIAAGSLSENYLAAVSINCDCHPSRCVCNSIGSRHCFSGWEPPSCQSSGCGGSLESNSAGLCVADGSAGLSSSGMIAVAVLGVTFGIVLVIVVVILAMGRRRLWEMWYNSRLFVEVEQLRDRFTPMRPASSSSMTEGQSDLSRGRNSSIRRSLRGPPGPAPVNSPEKHQIEMTNGHSQFYQVGNHSPQNLQAEDFAVHNKKPQPPASLVNINRRGASPTLNRRVGPSPPTQHRVPSAPIQRDTPQRPPPPRSAVTRPTVPPPPPPKTAGRPADIGDNVPRSVADAKRMFGDDSQKWKAPSSRTPPDESIKGEQWFSQVLKRNGSGHNDLDGSGSPSMQRRPMLNETAEAPLQRRPSYGAGQTARVFPKY